MMVNKLEWITLALAQPPDIQISLFPSFTAAADELATTWEEALEYSKDFIHASSDEQRAGVRWLDDLILSISGKNNLPFWTDIALKTFPEWNAIRKAAQELAVSYGWELRNPGTIDAVYVGPQD